MDAHFDHIGTEVELNDRNQKEKNRHTDEPLHTSNACLDLRSGVLACWQLATFQHATRVACWRPLIPRDALNASKSGPQHATRVACWDPQHAKMSPARQHATLKSRHGLYLGGDFVMFLVVPQKNLPK